MPTLSNDLSVDSRHAPSRAPGRFTTVCAVLALAAAVYSVFRIDSATDRLDNTREALRSLETTQLATRAELSSLAARRAEADRELQARLSEIGKIPQQLGDLQGSVEELRGRTDRPQRAWTRAEALFLLELANRRLKLDRDPDTAIVALQAADTQLADLREAGLAPVRTQIAQELQALQAVPRPDLSGIETQLEQIEQQAEQLKVAGIVTGQPANGTDAPLPDNGLQRAWVIVKHAASNLIVVRHLAGPDDSLVTVEQAALRQQHLELLIYSARQALTRRDSSAYAASIKSALGWIEKYFSASDPVVQHVAQDLRSLAQIDIAPPLPDISGSVQVLERSFAGRPLT